MATKKDSKIYPQFKDLSAGSNWKQRLSHLCKKQHIEQFQHLDRADKASKRKLDPFVQTGQVPIPYSTWAYLTIELNSDCLIKFLYQSRVTERSREWERILPHFHMQVLEISIHFLKVNAGYARNNVISDLTDSNRKANTRENEFPLGSPIFSIFFSAFSLEIWKFIDCINCTNASSLQFIRAKNFANNQRPGSCYQETRWWEILDENKPESTVDPMYKLSLSRKLLYQMLYLYDTGFKRDLFPVYDSIKVACQLNLIW